MELMFREYDLKINGLISDKLENGDWNKLITTHKVMLARIQQERLIHLQVMVFTGIVGILFYLALFITNNIFLIIPVIIIGILFMAYTFHYRFLENTTQKWYKIEDVLREKSEMVDDEGLEPPASSV